MAHNNDHNFFGNYQLGWLQRASRKSPDGTTRDLEERSECPFHRNNAQHCGNSAAEMACIRFVRPAALVQPSMRYGAFHELHVAEGQPRRCAL
jgi:hypothetical protein